MLDTALDPIPLTSELRAILHEFLAFAYLKPGEEAPLPGNSVHYMPIVVYNACAFVANKYCPGFSQDEVYWLTIDYFKGAENFNLNCSSRYPDTISVREVVETFLRKRKLRALADL